MQYGAVPDMSVPLQDDFLGGKGMQDAIVLHVGAGTYEDAAHIAA